MKLLLLYRWVPINRMAPVRSRFDCVLCRLKEVTPDKIPQVRWPQCRVKGSPPST